MENRRAESDTTSADRDAEPLGSGPKGEGSALEVGSHNRRRPLCDGGGLCSLGLGQAAQRPVIVSSRLDSVRAILDRGLANLDASFPGGYRKLFDRHAAGKVQEFPLLVDLAHGVAESLMKLWDREDQSARFQAGDRRMAVRGRLMQCLLKETGDLDWRCLFHYFRGVRLGGQP